MACTDFVISDSRMIRFISSTTIGETNTGLRPSSQYSWSSHRKREGSKVKKKGKRGRDDE